MPIERVSRLSAPGTEVASWRDAWSNRGNDVADRTGEDRSRVLVGRTGEEDDLMVGFAPELSEAGPCRLNRISMSCWPGTRAVAVRTSDLASHCPVPPNKKPPEPLMAMVAGGVPDPVSEPTVICCPTGRMTFVLRR